MRATVGRDKECAPLWGAIMKQKMNLTMPNGPALNTLWRALVARYRTYVRGGGVKSFDSKIAVLGYLFLCLSVFFFSYLLVTDPWRYSALSQEDHWVENLTSGLYLLAGFLLFATAWVERSAFPRCIYILGGLALVFVAGEEISWGQRIFGFTTPDFLMGLNVQNEFNVHNTGLVYFETIGSYGMLLLCLATGVAFCYRKDTLFGIPLPSMLLILGFLLALSYTRFHGYTMMSPDLLFSLSYVGKERALLLIFAIYTLLSGQARLFIATVVTVALVLALSYVHKHIYIGYMLEIYEYLFGMACLFYALELLLAQGRRAAGFPQFGIRAIPKSLKALMPPWPMVCSLAMVGSIGLALLQYFTIKVEAAAMEERYQLIMSAEPVARSDFDVYLIENRLFYFKEPCAPADTEPHFYLRVLFDNANVYAGGFPGGFLFDRRGAIFEGKCIATFPLPEHASISVIRTGQHVGFWAEDAIWTAKFSPSANQFLSGEVGDPIIRSDFDVYVNENSLFYFKEPCAPVDTEASFFLHVIPVDANDLPDHRKRYDFDDLGFGFEWRGVIFEGKCMAAIALPEYAIISIRTGQHADEGSLWEGKFRFDRHFTIKIEAAAMEERYRLIMSAEPVVRSDFDVYVNENRLFYFKEPCAPADTEALFFLHVIPVDANDLPDHRKPYDFDNLDFDFEWRGVIFEGKCMAERALPEYAITSIRTGQYTDEGSLWEGEFRFDRHFTIKIEAAAMEERYQLIMSAEPVVRSDFDVYVNENSLFYLKEPCAPADTEPHFFLHVIPVDANDLPDHRKPYDFDNLDFDFEWRGVMFEGKCMAAIALPEYAITSIRTGQFTDEGRLWEDEFRFDR